MGYGSSGNSPRISLPCFEHRRKVRHRQVPWYCASIAGHPYLDPHRPAARQIFHQSLFQSASFLTRYTVDSQYKRFSDPIHGFISVPRELLLPLIQTPEVQRLRRIRQLGVGYLVFPGGEHTRFTHALGAMALMQDTLAGLAEKGTPISPDEHRAALAAALLHDIGHSPFSHTLEYELVQGFRHEAMSRSLITALNERFDGALSLTLDIFDGTYERPFFNQLVSSQLDMDRLDYLWRDSFYTGVVEGRVGAQRIIRTMRVHPVAGGPEAGIVIEAKGIYAIENFLMARRLMYLQVYLHKTVLAGDQVLRAAIRRARTLLHRGEAALTDGTSPALHFFLTNKVDGASFEREEVRDAFCALDDADVLYSLKRWMRSPDPILADLSRRFIERDFFRTTFLPDLPSAEQRATWIQRVAEVLVSKGLTTPDQAEADAQYYVTFDSSRHATYEPREGFITILNKNGTVFKLSEMTDTQTINALAAYVVKPYVCYPKDVPFEETTAA